MDHCAAKVHSTGDKGQDPTNSCFNVNQLPRLDAEEFGNGTIDNMIGRIETRSKLLKSYVRTQFNNCPIIAKSLLDSGNHVGSALSLDFVRRNGLDYVVNKQRQSAGTAAQQSKLYIVGRINQLPIKIEGIPHTFKEDFYIIKNLSFPVNLGLDFMAP